MSSHIIYVLIVLFTLLNVGFSAKILGVFPVPSKSHHIIGHAFMKRLAENGHEVVYITSFNESVSSCLNYKQIVMTGFYEKMHADFKNLFEELDRNALSHSLFLKKWGQDLSRDVFEHPNMKEFLASNHTFDVVIVQQFFVESLKGLAWYYNAHLVVLSTLCHNTWLDDVIGKPSSPSYIPEMFSGHSTEMSFTERMENSFSRLVIELILKFMIYPAHNTILHDYFPNAPHLQEIIYNTSFAFVNTDIALNQAVPLVPNMAEIGGFHVNENQKLPENLRKILNEAEYGVVYFSMGSNLKSADLPTVTKKWLIKTFSKLRQKVLWKFEEDIPDLPDNLVISKWFPQNAILAHPNVKLFITHGGLLSTTEAIFFGLPVLTIPVFGDQKLNAIRSAERGYGLYIPFNQLNEHIFEKKLFELLDDKRYREKAKKLSKILKDKQMKPMETAIYWIEYILRHQGAPHLRVASLKLNIFQYLLIDVIMASGIFICLVIIIQKYLYNFIRKSLLSKKKND